MSSLLDSGEAAEPVAAEATQAVEEPSSERPSWLPEKYKTGEDLANAYKALESKLGAKEADLRKTIMDELEKESFANRPESKGDYQLPDFVDEAASIDNELLGWWAEHSFENGYSQEEFAKGIEMYRQAFEANQPNIEAETKKLGDNANDRIRAASMFANKFFPEEVMSAVERMCETSEGIMAIEAIMQATKESTGGIQTNPVLDVDEGSLQEMMRDERYWNPARRDPSFVRKVDEGFKRLYG